MELGLNGRVALITGASGGLGQAIARRFAMEGAAVVLGYYSQGQEAAKRLTKELTDINGAAQAFQVNVSDKKSVDAFLSNAVQAFGRVDVLVNNAGVLRPSLKAPLASMSLDQWDAMFHVHVAGTLFCTQAAVPYMKERRWGRIVNISSLHARTGGREGLGSYAAAKGTILTLSKAFSREFAPYNITTNAIIPGFIDAGMSRGLTDEIRQAIEAQNPLGRLGRAEEIAALAAFLSSDLAGYINGQAVPCDGGRFDYVL